MTQFSYCMETIIQAGNKRLRIASVPITTNPKTRESRLFKSIWQHMAMSGQAISRSYVMFKPHAVFITLGLAFLVAALVPFVRFLVLLLIGDAGDHIQSLIFGVAMLIGSLLCFALLVIADLERTNRVLLEETLERLKEVQYGRCRSRQVRARSPMESSQSTSQPRSSRCRQWRRAPRHGRLRVVARRSDPLLRHVRRLPPPSHRDYRRGPARPWTDSARGEPSARPLDG
ncbi:phage holin family protein [Cellulosimicrobium sp. CUA-896]|uniref:phage holin family protein n=1 Tax=Cellulosimicrobium sp. CUA-896 TaxID=1517881 RepID=UPI000A476C2A